MTMFPKPLADTINYYGLIRPYSTVSVIRPHWFCISTFQLVPFPLQRRIGSPVPQMSLGKAPAALMPDSGVVDKLVIPTLIPCDRPTHGFQNR